MPRPTIASEAGALWGVWNNTRMDYGLPEAENPSCSLDGLTSSALDVLFGVPQGTVLGPLLFLTYINYLPECTNSDARLFADDCLVYRQIRRQRNAAK